MKKASPAAKRDVVAFLLRLPVGAPSKGARLHTLCMAGLIEIQHGPEGEVRRLTPQGLVLAWRTLAENLPPGAAKEAAQAEMLRAQRAAIAAATHAEYPLLTKERA